MRSRRVAKPHYTPEWRGRTAIFARQRASGGFRAQSFRECILSNKANTYAVRSATPRAGRLPEEGALPDRLQRLQLSGGARLASIHPLEDRRSHQSRDNGHHHEHGEESGLNHAGL